MREELEEFKNWVKENKNVDLSEYTESFLIANLKPRITKTELFRIICIMTMAEPLALYIKHNGHAAARTRGYIVKTLLRNPSLFFPLPLTSMNIYYELFDFHLDHSSALHFKNTVEYYGDELVLYEKIVALFNKYEIIWNE